MRFSSPVPHRTFSSASITSPPSRCPVAAGHDRAGGGSAGCSTRTVGVVRCLVADLLEGLLDALEPLELLGGLALQLGGHPELVGLGGDLVAVEHLPGGPAGCAFDARALDEEILELL